MKCDFSGYATKNNIKCSDGRVIRENAFKECDGKIVPLVFQHMHNDLENVLGQARLENRKDGVYAYCSFNGGEKAKQAKELVKHGDLTSMSIFANQLIQNGSDVIHGSIKEVSLVLAGANPGATIDNVAFSHSDGSVTESDDEAVISFRQELEFEDSFKHSDEGGSMSEKTVGDVFNTLNEEQKKLVYAMISNILEDSSMSQSLEEGDDMKFNVFENGDKSLKHAELDPDVVEDIFAYAKENGSLRESVLAHAAEYGIEDIDILFPDAKTVTPTPELISRNMDWVQKVLSGTTHTPFSRIKSTAADITADEARAKGYVKGNLKKEEIVKLLKRVTTPTTIYKKQKLDRDDIIDITDLNVVSWIKSEMRLMLDEELARAIMVGDGREVDDEDKINEENIRPIWKDDDMYAHHVSLENTVTTEDMIDAIIKAKKQYKGSGNPVLYTTTDVLTDMLLLKDKMGRRLYRNASELASELNVSSIVEVEVMEGLTREDSGSTKLDLIGIVVNLKDYKVGADKGGSISMFDDFDIDYNQYKYLMETRCSGALTKPKSALVIEKKQGA